MKRNVYSRYKVGDLVVLKKKHGKFHPGHKFLVTDPLKRGKRLNIQVKDPDTNETTYVCSKYLKLYK